MPKFTYEPGRQIYLNGEPFISINREGDTAPVVADAVTRAIARALASGRVRVPTSAGAALGRSRRRR